MQFFINVVDRHAELERLVLVHGGEELRNGGGEQEIRLPQFGTFTGGGQELRGVAPEIVHIMAGAVLDKEIDPAGLTDAGDGGWRESERYGAGKPEQLPIYGLDNRSRLQRRRHALVIGFQAAEEKGVTGTTRL